MPFYFTPIKHAKNYRNLYALYVLKKSTQLMTIGAILHHFFREHPEFRLEYNVSLFLNCTFVKN
ncbi:hypothetical protein FLAVO9R_70009 [Flavobacterium sp. 9R]|nr:hypothetical protein FLAVO9R_70009 [Flavobacterium sp. 9R]